MSKWVMRVLSVLLAVGLIGAAAPVGWMQVSAVEITTYTLTVNGGILNYPSNEFAAGDLVGIEAAPELEGQQFKRWDISPAVTFDEFFDANRPMTIFIMPNQAVTATAIYEDVYAVTVVGGYIVGNNEFFAGDLVTIENNPTPVGKRFKEWDISPSVTFADGTNVMSETVKFIMPAQPVVAKAILEANVCEIIGEAQYATLDAATAAVDNGQTIRLIEDVTLDNHWYIDNGKTFTFDTNGRTLYFDDYIVKDVICTYSMILNSGNITINGCESILNLDAIDANGISAKAVLNGDLTAGSISAYDGAEIEINGNFVGKPIAMYDGSKITIQGNVTGTDDVFACYGAEVVVNGNVTSELFGVTAGANGRITVGGNVTSDDIGVYVEVSGQVTVDGTITAPSYIVFDDAEKTINDYEAVTTKMGYRTYTDGTSTVWVKEVAANVCEIIGGAKYATLDAATAAVDDGQTIRLIEDVTLDNHWYIDNGKAFTFDTNGRTLYFDEVIVDDGYGYYTSILLNSGNITINGCENILNLHAIDANGISAKAVLNGDLAAGRISAYDGAEIEINGNFVGRLTAMYENSKITINGNVVESKAVFVAYGGEILVNGNITVTDTVDNYGVFAGDSGRIIVIGNITSDYIGVCVENGGQVTVDGTISALIFMDFYGVEKTINDYEAVTTKMGYRTYTDGTSTVWVKEIAITTYAVAVNGGTGGGDYEAGASVTITASPAPSGQQFKQWNISPSVTFTSGGLTTSTATFTMPAEAVTATAVYEAIPQTTYTLTVVNGTGGGDYEAGANVPIEASAPPSGKIFDRWTATNGNFTDSNSSTTTFIMPAGATTVTANYKNAPANNTALLNRINEISNTQQGNYTNASWNAFQNALNEAQSIANDETATQDQVDAALSSLNTAYANLQTIKTIFGTKYESTFLYWILFFLGFGWIWMWF